MRYLLLSGLLIHSSFTANAQETEEKEAHNVLPALKVLPAGSILKDVRIPRYTAELLPASFLKAKKLTIISNKEVEGVNVDVTLFDDSGKPKLTSHLNQLLYNQSDGTIVSRQDLVFQSDTFTIKSKGLVTDWDTQQGFLLGKTETIIYLKDSLSMKSSPKKSLLNKTAAVAFAASAITYPDKLSAQDIAELDTISKPSSAMVQEIDTKNRAQIAAFDTLADSLSKLKQDALPLLLLLPPAVEKVEQKEEQKEAKPEDALNLLNAIKITSEGTPFFDAKKGILIHEKNFSATSDRFKFETKGEVKLLAEEKPDVKKLTPEAKKKLKFDERYHVRAIASDTVRIRMKDKDDNPVRIDTDNFIYDHNARTIIIRGIGSVFIYKAKGIQLQIVKKDGYIKVELDDDYELDNMTPPGTELFVELDKLKDDKKKQP